MQNNYIRESIHNKNYKSTADKYVQRWSTSTSTDDKCLTIFSAIKLRITVVVVAQHLPERLTQILRSHQNYTKVFKGCFFNTKTILIARVKPSGYKLKKKTHN